MSKAVHVEVALRYQSPDPCPVCGGDQVEVDDDHIECRYFCRCIECGHRGVPSFVKQAAVAFWNREEREA